MIFVGAILNETLTMYLSLTLCGVAGINMVAFGGADSFAALRATSILVGCGLGPIFSCILLYMEKYVLIIVLKSFTKHHC